MRRVTWTAQSMVICCPSLSSDVTNILIGSRKQQFPSNWKTLRPFRRWCYFVAVLPSWPSMNDEPLYISFLPLWMEPKLHHHSNGCLDSTPRDIVIPQIAWKEIVCVVVVDFEALKASICVQMWSCIWQYEPGLDWDIKSALDFCPHWPITNCQF